MLELRYSGDTCAFSLVCGVIMRKVAATTRSAHARVLRCSPRFATQGARAFSTASIEEVSGPRPGEIYSEVRARCRAWRLGNLGASTAGKPTHPQAALTHAPQEHYAMQETITRFIEKEINPYVDQWEADGIFPAKELFKKCATAAFSFRTSAPKVDPSSTALPLSAAERPLFPPQVRLARLPRTHQTRRERWAGPRFHLLGRGRGGARID